MDAWDGALRSVRSTAVGLLVAAAMAAAGGRAEAQSAAGTRGTAPAAPAATPAASAAKAAPLAAATWTDTTAFYREQLAKHGIVGSSLFVVKDGQVAARAFEGLADRDAKTPVDAQTIFHWGSITKTFTGIAIMQLRDRGLLQLDDSVVKYIPELRQVHNPFGDMSAITIRHLMSHSAGFRGATWTWSEGKDWEPFEPPTWKQIDAMLPYSEVLFTPGSKFSYSNPGIIYLGRIVELLTNEDFEMYVTKNVLAPLGMRETFFDRAPNYLRAHRAHSYYRTDEGLKEARFDFDTGITVANGGLNAPLTDMVKYVAFVMGGDPSKAAEYDVVLKRSSLEEMFKPQIAADEATVSIGLNFFVEKRGGLELVGHSGSQNGFLSHFYVHIPSRSAYIVAYNTDASSKTKGTEQSTRALDAALRDYLVAHVFSALQQPPAGKAAPGTGR